MAVRVDEENKKITLGMKDMLYDDFLRVGLSGEMSPIDRLALGRRVHGKHQEDRISTISSYRKEQHITYETEIDDYRVSIHGRIDGIYQDESKSVVEEIKSVFLVGEEFEKTTEDDFRLYASQLRLYMYFLESGGIPNVTGHLVLISLVDNGVRVLPVTYDPDEVAALIESWSRRIINRIEESRRQLERRIEVSEKLVFPFPEMRKYQDDMVDEIQKSLSAERNILISAPPGIGKTAASLFSSVKYAFSQGYRVFFNTSKTTQQEIVLGTLRDLWADELDFTAVLLRAKQKMCCNEIYLCHPDFCPYAEDYSEKLDRTGIIEDLLSESIISPDLVSERASEAGLCPFGVSLELTLLVDVVVCDYNYVFDPDIYLRMSFLKAKHSDLVLIVDEAHNLYSRGRDYYSPELSGEEIQLLRSSRIHDPLPHGMIDCLESIEDYLREMESETRALGDFQQCPVDLDGEFFENKKELLEEALPEYLAQLRERGRPSTDDPLVDFYHRLARFCNVLSIGGEEFSYILDREGAYPSFKILCRDPSNQLGKRIEEFYGVVAMSGTLTPITFYRDVLGFPEDQTDLVELPSPFPSENRKILVIPDVSTKYRDRPRYYRKTARVIGEIVSKKKGNYFAFFPSFEYLRQVMWSLDIPGYEIVAQERSMSDNDRSTVLSMLREGRHGKGRLVLGVQGGVFAEGVDYPGESLIGVIIVGPALPRYDFRGELIKAYYQEKYGRGFEYAYLYPGMNRAIQSAGRVIRDKDDVGIVVLLGKRFASPYYSSVFPSYWYGSSPAELVSEDFEKDIEEFWSSF